MKQDSPSLRQCRVCETVKPFNRIHWKTVRGKSGGRVCKSCHAMWMRNYRAQRTPEQRQAARDYENQKYRTNTHYRINAKAARRLRYMLVEATNQNVRLWPSGYFVSDLRRHIERQFRHRMSWDNYGKWHIDHIVPLDAFDIQEYGDDEFTMAWSLENLRPEWAMRNIRKQHSREFLV